MKQYTSVLMLHIRSTFYKILIVFAAMAGAEFFLFSRHLSKMLASDFDEDILRLGLGMIFDDSKIHFVFLGAFLLINIILVLHGFEFKEKLSYTIRRLSIPEKHCFILQGLYYSLIYILLFVVQLVIIWLLSQYYFKTVPENLYSNQTLFLTFYSSNFLHSLLPLEETVRVVRNIFIIFALGFSGAYQSYTQRRGKKQGSFLILALIVLLTFQSELGTFGGDLIAILASVTVLCIIIYNMLRKGNGYEI